MGSEHELAVARAERDLQQAGYADPAAWDPLRQAQRELAASQHESWVEPIELGAEWDGGAPLPHVLSDGSTTILLCRAATVDPAWDGTYAHVVNPHDPEPQDLIEIRFTGCWSIRFGAPNDETIHGHPLAHAGLQPYRANLVHASAWAAEMAVLNSVHPHHRPESFDRLKHYLLSFHDETFEALATGIDVRRLRATFRDALSDASTALTT